MKLSVEQKDRFLEHGIPYDDLDPEMIEMIDVLNFTVGLKTKFCCYGHDAHTFPEVMFHESVTDEQILSLLKQMSEHWEGMFEPHPTMPRTIPVFFYKLVRANPPMINWKLNFMRRFVDPNGPEKKTHFDIVVGILKNCKA